MMVSASNTCYSHSLFPSLTGTKEATSLLLSSTASVAFGVLAVVVVAVAVMITTLVIVIVILLKKLRRAEGILKSIVSYAIAVFTLIVTVPE